jgi:hypothetical protein
MTVPTFAFPIRLSEKYRPRNNVRDLRRLEVELMAL